MRFSRSCMRRASRRARCGSPMSGRCMTSRACGKRFKEASPPLVREYVYYVTTRKYGDPLGPDYDALRRRKTDAEIIESASRPIRDLDDRLNEADFRVWYEEVYCKEKG